MTSSVTPARPSSTGQGQRAGAGRDAVDGRQRAGHALEREALLHDASGAQRPWPVGGEVAARSWMPAAMARGSVVSTSAPVTPGST